MEDIKNKLFRYCSTNNSGTVVQTINIEQDYKVDILKIELFRYFSIFFLNIFYFLHCNPFLGTLATTKFLFHEFAHVITPMGYSFEGFMEWFFGPQMTMMKKGRM